MIYHEYGHFADDMAGGITNGGLSEGWGDIVATYATGQPLIGRDFTGPGTFMRTADNNPLYDPSLPVHAVGESWAGFAWHMKENLGPEGRVWAVELILYPLIVNSPNIPAALADLIVYDDDDGNLGNCTLHSNKIIPAALRHGIPLPAGLPVTCQCP